MVDETKILSYGQLFSSDLSVIWVLDLSFYVYGWRKRSTTYSRWRGGEEGTNTTQNEVIEVKNENTTSQLIYVVGTDAYTMVVVYDYIMGEPEQCDVGSEEHENGERKTGGWPGFDD